MRRAAITSTPCTDEGPKSAHAFGPSDRAVVRRQRTRHHPSVIGPCSTSSAANCRAQPFSLRHGMTSSHVVQIHVVSGDRFVALPPIVGADLRAGLQPVQHRDARLLELRRAHNDAVKLRRPSESRYRDCHSGNNCCRTDLAEPPSGVGQGNQHYLRLDRQHLWRRVMMLCLKAYHGNMCPRCSGDAEARALSKTFLTPCEDPVLLRDSAESLFSDARGRLDTASPPDDAALVALPATLVLCSLS